MTSTKTARRSRNIPPAHFPWNLSPTGAAPESSRSYLSAITGSNHVAHPGGTQRTASTAKRNASACDFQISSDFESRYAAMPAALLARFLFATVFLSLLLAWNLKPCLAQTSPPATAPTWPQATLTDQQPPFDKLELFGLFAAGPVAAYSKQVIQKRGCTFTPDAAFIANFPTPAFQEILKNIKPRGAKKLSPDRDAAYELLPRALIATHHRQFAISDEYYQEALRLAPNSATLHLAYATNFLLVPDGVKAEAEARRSLELWPDNAEAHGILSLAFMAQGNVAGAVAEARETLRIFPQHTSAKFQLGVALAQNHQYEEAIPALRNALAVLPKVPALHKFLGISLLNTKQTDESISQLTWYVNAEPADPEGHYFLGVALRSAGRQSEADSQFQQAEHLKTAGSQ